jgi:hypothetical protein
MELGLVLLGLKLERLLW